jgi:hypothetical protein
MRPVTVFIRTTVVLLFGCFSLVAQIDPYARELIQLGYNGAFQGHQPLAAYAFYYRNVPEFLREDLTLRLAVAPTYLDSELGFAKALGEHTDLGLGLSGGGFADSYVEIREGVYRPKESFFGYGGGLSASVYHLFNPESQIPLTAVLRGVARYATYDDTQDTARDFEIPGDLGSFHVRTGLRWGGREPLLFPSLAMELSAWYDGEFRTDRDHYGFDKDRSLNAATHLFWGQATLVYTLPKLKHSFDVSLSTGTSVESDRFSSYRLGAFLPLISEFPLSIPGYYYQEISARQFVLFSANYLMPLDSRQRWNLTFTGATAWVDYINGLEQPGNSHSGVGGGVMYRTEPFKMMVGYAYGIDALRTGGRGAHSIGVLMQLDFGQVRKDVFTPASPNLWRGFQRVLGVFGN